MWRLIISPPAHGAWNMAVDEAILEATVTRTVSPTLRFYAWHPPCLSLGYAQPASDADLVRVSANGWDIVRRLTGGRAILHTDELTYAVIGPQEEPRLTGSVLESYQRLSLALLNGLKLLGIPAEAKSQPPLPTGRDPIGPVCFEVPSNYEITVNGRKLIGSAQARRMKGVLQHGTLPLYGDIGRITQALAFEDDLERERSADRLHNRASTVENILGGRVEWLQAAQTFIQAFESALNIQLTRAELTSGERDRATQLAQEKYSHLGWTERV
jgi:lipoate-protein ligase A